jgi:hypothetical protein
MSAETERTPWWLDEMIRCANTGRGHYEVAIPLTVLEDWIATARELVRRAAEEDNDAEAGDVPS